MISIGLDAKKLLLVWRSSKRRWPDRRPVSRGAGGMGFRAEERGSKVRKIRRTEAAAVPQTADLDKAQGLEVTSMPKITQPQK